ncbi:LysR family transcriptional regulator [Tuberibacillus sp. Marseille-P3662]|uniref:LysR family transcriptional regulator n=1 Tax=Tuberibacillus sp. Marseille-P3662 TaxID=1965358 RepID=UPI000A1C8223|nr:LysR family transcriptional regulator [Tuberibacillus sp. Marseille-P3662]
MDIRQLKYFVAIAEEGNITKAAHRLHMAQPPLSRQLKQMEDELDVQLFERNKKKQVTLTYEGNVFLNRAKNILNQFEDSIIEVQELKEKVSGTLAIGSTIFCANMMLSKIVSLRENHPDLTFNIWEGDSVRLNELLENRQIEIAITSSPVPKGNIERKKLSSDPYVLVLPKKWSIDIPDNIELAGISDLPLVLLRPNRGIGLYDHVILEFNRRDLHPNILCECHDSVLLFSLVAAGFGATILPSSMLSLSDISQFRTINIKSNPLLLEPAILWRSNSYLSKPAQEFIALFGDD